MNENFYAVILAGGKGERLWPLSRSDTPKQVLHIKPGISLLQETIDRISPLIRTDKRFILTTQEQHKAIRKSIKDPDVQMLLEPATKNTGPAILYTCMNILQHDPDAIIGFLPADHFMLQEDIFQKAFFQALSWANTHDSICLLGVKPQWPATGYGYIEFHSIDEQEIKKVIRFHEKPDKRTAEIYFSSTSMLWNIGIFCAKAKIFLHEFEIHQPEMIMAMKTYMQTNDSSIYQAFKALSFDYAIMEKSCQVHVLPLDITWSDVGNLYEFLRLQKEYQKNQPIQFESKNNLVYSKNNKLIALIGIDDLCIVETNDVLLIVQQKDVEKVKNVLTTINKQRLFTFNGRDKK